MKKNCDTRTDLFWSPFMEPFSRIEYLEDHPEINVLLSPGDTQENSKESISAAEDIISEAATHHNNLHQIATAAARNECATCPALDWCRQLVLDTKDPIYGIAAGMNERERRAYRKSGGITVTRGEAADLLLNGVR